MLTRQLDQQSETATHLLLRLFREDQKDTMKAVEEMVYTNWDNSDSAPPKARPTEPMAGPNIGLF